MAKCKTAPSQRSTPESLPYLSAPGEGVDGYYKEYFNDLAATCENLPDSEIVSGLERLAQVIAPHMERFIEAGWSRKADQALVHLRAGALESAAFALVPAHIELTVAQRNNAPRVIVRASGAGCTAAFSQNAGHIATGIVAAMLRAVAECLRGR